MASNSDLTMTAPQVLPVVEPKLARDRWGLIIFNNDHNTIEEVIFGLMASTQCGIEEATIEAWEAHTYGQAWVHFGSREDCRRAALVMEAIGVQTEVRKEWEEE